MQKWRSQSNLHVPDYGCSIYDYTTAALTRESNQMRNSPPVSVPWIMAGIYCTKSHRNRCPSSNHTESTGSILRGHSERGPPPTLHRGASPRGTRADVHGLAAFADRGGVFAEQHSAYLSVTVQLGPLQRGLSGVVFERVVRTFCCCVSNGEWWTMNVE